VSFSQTVVLGALAGFTIFLGLPFGRLQLLSTRGRVALAMFSVGVLAFLFVDVLSHGFAIVEKAVTGYKDGSGSFGHAAALAAILGGGFALGTAGLATIERRIRGTAPAPPSCCSAKGATRSPPPASSSRGRDRRARRARPGCATANT